MTGDLHARMLAAHQGPDPTALITLYTEAANGANSLDASCFFLTHAYVFALEAGAPQASQLHWRLMQNGREE
jgi:spore coat protein U-like protein